MNRFLEVLVNSIIREEGEPADAKNPGNLRGTPWLALQQPMLNGFWVPGSRAEGVAGLAHVAALHIAQGNTLRQFIAGAPNVYSGFAPGKDHNDPTTYVNNLTTWIREASYTSGKPAEFASFDPDEPMWNYVE